MSLGCVSDPEYNPLETRDVHDPDWYYRQDVDLWLRTQGVNPCNVYRYELYVIDTPCLRVFEYVCDEQGKTLYDRDRDVLLVREPYMIPIDSFPPTITEIAGLRWPTPYTWSNP